MFSGFAELREGFAIFLVLAIALFAGAFVSSELLGPAKDAKKKGGTRSNKTKRSARERRKRKVRVRTEAEKHEVSMGATRRKGGRRRRR